MNPNFLKVIKRGERKLFSSFDKALEIKKCRIRLEKFPNSLLPVSTLDFKKHKSFITPSNI